MKVAEKKIGTGNPCFIIAEIGSNQDKNKEMAIKLIDMAANAGVDAVKFQTAKCTDIAKLDTPANAYGDFDFIKGKKYWHEVLDEFLLPYEWHKELFEYAKSKGLIVFSTPESKEAVELLESINNPVYKISSTDIDYFPLLKEVAKTGKPVILSGGMADIKQIKETIDFLKENGAGDIALLHCISDYPPKYEDMTLEMIPYYKSVFDIPIGFSDHCETNLLDGAAVALGANIIEKHITLDKKSIGPDHSFALDQEGLIDLVNTVRQIEKGLPINENALKRKETKQKLYRRSIIIKNPKKSGEIIDFSDLDFKRPGSGISPVFTDIVCGMALKKDVSQNHILLWEDLK